jgi:hypothetical protein
MPKFTGQSDVVDANQSVADSLRSISEGMFRPLDPLTRERLSEAQRRQVSRANAVAALQRGDMQEYYAQSLLAAQPGADALAYHCRPLSSVRAAAFNVYGLDRLGDPLAVADTNQMLNESTVGLAMDGRERHARYRHSFEHFGVKGIGARIVHTCKHVLLGERDDWRKLQEITN